MNTSTIRSFQACTAPTSNDILYVVSNTAGQDKDYNISLGKLLSQSNLNISATKLTNSNAPSNNVVYDIGTLFFDNNYLYIVVSNNVIKKVNLI